MFSLAVKCIWYQYLIVQNQKKNVMKTPAKSASTHKMDLTVNWLHLSFEMRRCFIKGSIVNLPSPPIYIYRDDRIDRAPRLVATNPEDEIYTEKASGQVVFI